MTVSCKDPSETLRCDQCGAVIVGEPPARALFASARGDEISYDEPPLCEDCAELVTLSAYRRLMTPME